MGDAGQGGTGTPRRLRPAQIDAEGAVAPFLKSPPHAGAIDLIVSRTRRPGAPSGDGRWCGCAWVVPKPGIVTPWTRRAVEAEQSRKVVDCDQKGERGIEAASRRR